MALSSAMAYLHADELQPKTHRDNTPPVCTTSEHNRFPPCCLTPNRAGYYSEIDLMQSKKFYGEDFAGLSR